MFGLEAADTLTVADFSYYPVFLILRSYLFTNSYSITSKSANLGHSSLIWKIRRPRESINIYNKKIFWINWGVIQSSHIIANSEILQAPKNARSLGLMTLHLQWYFILLGVKLFLYKAVQEYYYCWIFLHFFRCSINNVPTQTLPKISEFKFDILFCNYIS